MFDLDALGAKLSGQFDMAKSQRQMVEQRWLEDLRQYRGGYSPAVEARLNRSKTFVRITRTKVKSATARLMDMVFPAGNNDSWSISPSPVPDIDLPSHILLSVAAAQGHMPTPNQENSIKRMLAKTAAERMEAQIRDQLGRLKYKSIMRDVIQSGNLYGTGIAKGPMVNHSYEKHWQLVDGKWALQLVKQISPYVEFAPLWRIYPDMTASDFSDVRFVYDRHVMPKHKVIDLSKREDFDADMIRRVLTEHPAGNVVLQPWETELRAIGLDWSGCYHYKESYEIPEFWGAISAKDLADVGLELPDDSLLEYWANVWMLAGRVIKIEVQPIEGVGLPFFAYYWDKDETSIFGEGIPAIIRDDQDAYNALTRATLDNAGITAGPQIEVNVDLMSSAEDTNEVFPFKVWKRTGIGIDSQYPALRVYDIASHIPELANMADRFKNQIDEATIPAYMHGEGVSKGSVGRTASGLSMLMSAAQIVFKDQLFSIDEGVQRPFIEGMFHWNMQFNEDESIKGDHEIAVRGTSSLVAREIRAQNLTDFANSTMNEFDAPYVDRRALNRERAVVLELGDDIIMSDEQVGNNLAAETLKRGTENLSGVGGGVKGVGGLGPGGFENNQPSGGAFNVPAPQAPNVFGGGVKGGAG